MIRAPISPTIASGHIYQALYSMCPQYVLAPPWDVRQVDADVRSCPADSVAVLDALARQYSRADLLGAGVAQQGPGESLAPAIGLEAGRPLIFLRRQQGENPFEVLTPQGYLSRRSLSLGVALDDHWTARALAESGVELLVTFCVEDVAVFRALGLGATLATGLETLRGPELLNVCSRFGWKHRGVASDGPGPGRPAAGDIDPDLHTRAGRAASPEPKAREHSRVADRPRMSSAATPGPSVGARAATRARAAPTAPSKSYAKEPPDIPAPTAPAGARPDQNNIPERPAARTRERTEVPAGCGAQAKACLGAGEVIASEEFAECDEAGAIPPLAVVLVAWSPSVLTADRPAALEPVQSHLRRLHKHLRLEGMEVGLWESTPAYLERLDFQLHVAPWAVSAADVLAELEQSCLDALSEHPVAAAAAPPADYAEAARAIREAWRAHDGRSAGLNRVRRAQDQLEELLERDLLEPAASPVDRIRQAVLMQCLRQLHGASLSLGTLAAQGSQVLAGKELSRMIQAWTSVVLRLLQELPP